MGETCKVIRSLLDISVGEPETQEVLLPRLGLKITLQEISYDTLMKCRREKEASLHYLLESAKAPNFRDPAWYQDRLHCPTPIDAMKKLLRGGEIERLCQVADRLNGYRGGRVISMEVSEDQLRENAISAAVEDLEKN